MWLVLGMPVQFDKRLGIGYKYEPHLIEVPMRDRLRSRFFSYRIIDWTQNKILSEKTLLCIDCNPVA